MSKYDWGGYESVRGGYIAWVGREVKRPKPQQLEMDGGENVTSRPFTYPQLRPSSSYTLHGHTQGGLAISSGRGNLRWPSTWWCDGWRRVKVAHVLRGKGGVRPSVLKRTYFGVVASAAEGVRLPCPSRWGTLLSGWRYHVIKSDLCCIVGRRESELLLQRCARPREKNFIRMAQTFNDLDFLHSPSDHRRRYVQYLWIASRRRKLPKSSDGNSRALVKRPELFAIAVYVVALSDHVKDSIADLFKRWYVFGGIVLCLDSLCSVSWTPPTHFSVRGRDLQPC